MMRRFVPVFVALLVLAGSAVAADKQVKGTIVRVDAKKKILVVKTTEGRKEYMVNDETKFIGPKGGVSDKGILDDRLTPGTAVRLVIAGNNKTVHTVHLPERKRK